jgi:general secretion pathway protein C
MKTANAPSGSNTWTLRLFTFFVWAAVGLCAAYWAYKFVTTQAVAATAAVAAPMVVVDTKAVAKLLGATDTVAAKPIITAPSVKLTLFGLATSRNGQGYALIATEDKPAKPYRVGAKVTDDLVLKSISKVDAVLAASTDAPDSQTLSLPNRKPATYVASSAAGGSAMLAQTSGFGPPPVPPAMPPAMPPTATPAGQLERGFANAAAAASAANPAERPVSRFSPRAAAAAAAAGAAGAQPPGNAISPDGSTINPAAAVPSGIVPGLKAVSPSADSAYR